MLKLVSLCTAICLTSVFYPAEAQTPRPLSDAFQKFCVATEAHTDAITAAVQRAGGKARAATSTTWPRIHGVVTTTWAVPFERREFEITAVNVESTGSSPARQECSISSTSSEDDSLPAIRAWIGVRTYASSPSPAANQRESESYTFTVEGGVHHIVPPGEPTDAAAANAGQWMVYLEHDDSSAAVTLVRIHPVVR